MYQSFTNKLQYAPGDLGMNLSTAYRSAVGSWINTSLTIIKIKNTQKEKTKHAWNLLKTSFVQVLNTSYMYVYMYRYMYIMYIYMYIHKYI